MNLRDLVTTHKGTRTYATLSADCGGYPSDKRLQQLATQVQKKFVDPETVRALAKGLRVSEAAVVLAAAEDLGLDIRRATPRLLDHLPPGLDNLTDTEINEIAQTVRLLVKLFESNRDLLQATATVQKLPTPSWIELDEQAAFANVMREDIEAMGEMEEQERDLFIELYKKDPTLRPTEWLAAARKRGGDRRRNGA